MTDRNHRAPAQGDPNRAEEDARLAEENSRHAHGANESVLDLLQHEPDADGGRERGLSNRTKAADEQR